MLAEALGLWDSDVCHDAQIEPISHSPLCCGKRRIAQTRRQIYAAVFSGPGCQDDSDSRQGIGKQRNSRAPEYSPGCRLGVAQTVLSGTPAWFRRTRSSGSSPDFSPLIWSCRSKLGLVNCPPLTICHCLAGVLPIWRERSVVRVWWPPSAAARCGAGCIKTPFGLGITGVGSSPRIQSLLKRLVACWIYMGANGRISR